MDGPALKLWIVFAGVVTIICLIQISGFDRMGDQHSLSNLQGGNQGMATEGHLSF
jgi:hypothetical protein